MADSTLAALGAHTPAIDADSLYIESAGVAKKVAASVIKTYCSLSPSLVTPALGVPASGVISACTSTGQVLTSPVIASINSDLSVVGTVESADATTPILSTAAGKTNTGYLSLAGKTSGSLKVLPADAMGQLVTIAPAAQTVGAAVLGIPDMANVNSDFVFTSLLQTLSSKILSSPKINDGDTHVTITSANQTHAAPTVTIPDISDAADSFVMNDTVATLTLKTLTAPVINGGDYNGVSMSVTQGAGWAGVTSVASEITKQGKVITTHIFLDIQGLVVEATDGDVIGDEGANNSHGGQVDSAESGQFFSGSVTCLEAPTVGNADIDFIASDTAAQAEGAAIAGTNVTLVAGGGAWTLGMVKAMTGVPNSVSEFLFLTNGASANAGTYGAGQFLIELKGYEA